ncbi:MAG: TetR/AcrR family transcriptional regulator, partial [Acidimicrobiales bacterium]
GRPRSIEVDQAILAAALRMLGEHGFDGLTMEGVASEAGVGKATLYRRWPSKTDLVLDAIRSLKPIVDHPDNGDLRSDLIELVTGALSWGGDGEYTEVVSALISEMRRNTELATVYREQFLAPRRAESLVMIQRGIDRGEVRPDVDVDLVLDMLIGTIIYRSMITGGELSEAMAERAVDQVLRGIAVGPDRT